MPSRGACPRQGLVFSLPAPVAQLFVHAPHSFKENTTMTTKSTEKTHSTSTHHTRPLPPNSPTAGKIGKTRPAMGDPLAAPKEPLPFEAPPALTRNFLTLPLEVVAPDAAQTAQAKEKLVFHSVGDTGGVHGTSSQDAIAAAMEAQIHNAKTDEDRPAFFFHLGDVIYFNGQSENYTSQFYEPYQYYQAPIFAIPGNHDGDNHVRKGDQPDGEPSLYGFMRNFCDTTAQAVSPYRNSMTQPYCYFRLDAPFVSIIGLYSNIGGSLDARGSNEQQAWFEQALAQVPKNNKVIVAVHHPPFSLDSVHGGYPDILTSIDRAVAKTKQNIHGVLSGHVHNYQRFSRDDGTRQVPYIVAGAGGYPTALNAMHQLQQGLRKEVTPGKPFQTKQPGVQLASFDVQNPGFLRITVTPADITYDYCSVPFDESPSKVVDTVTVKN
jgi:hypothetical protein